MRRGMLRTSIIMMNGGLQGELCQKPLTQSSLGGGGWQVSPSANASKGGRKRHVLTSEMPHLCVLPRARLRQDLACRNALQAFGHVSVEGILAATRGGLLRRSLSEDRRRGREEATLCKAYVLRQPAP